MALVKYSPKKRKFTRSNVGQVTKRIATAALPYAANAILPGSGNFVRGAYLAGKAFNKWKSLVKARKAKGTPKGYETMGRYSGRFKKAKTAKTQFNIHSNKGIVDTYETHGTVADPDCVYISAQALDGFRVVEIAVLALMRKLFQKAGFVISNVDDLLPSTSISTSVDWQISLTQVNGKTGAETVLTNYITVAGSTLRTVAAQFNANFLRYSSGETNTGAGSATTDLPLKRLILFRQDYNVSRGFVFETELNLLDEIMCVKGVMELKVQNRTLSATGSSDAENVDNNPLIGRIYEFSNIPRMRDRSAFALSSIPVVSGVQIVRAAQITAGGNSTFREPPLPTLFTNCKKTVKVRLEPGAVKTYKLSYTKNMSFLTYLQRIRLQYGTGTEFLCYWSEFPSVMVSMEDLINVNASQNISCAYESNRTLGIYFKTRRKATGVMTMDQQTYNNIPA